MTEAPMQQPMGGADHDIFQDPALNASIQRDPLFLFLKQWWRHVAVVAAVALLGVYAKGVFDENRRAELGQAADTYANLQQALKQMPTLETKLTQAQSDLAAAAVDKKEAAQAKVKEAQAELDKAKVRVEGVLKTLAETREPYKTLAQLHQGVLSAQALDIDNVLKVLSPDRWRTIEVGSSADRFYAELEALVVARAFIDSQTHHEQGRALLASLAEQGHFVAITAATSLARVAETSEQRAQARAVLEKLAAAHSEQSDLVNPVLEELQSFD
ncbi:MAG: hypothetical protein K1X79_04680 [Oligoflexia bacterium]|nr:hypothetical protein [Oligoflexia bacterium]